MFGYTWSILRPMAFELGRRLVEIGTFKQADDVFFMTSDQLEQAISERSHNRSMPELGELAAELREYREACKQHHPPGTLPALASEIDAVSFKETQIKNDEDSNVMRGFPVRFGFCYG